jgi:hypothetical protein
VVAKVRDGLAVNKQRPHIFDMERFNLKKLNDVEGKEQIVLQLWKIWTQRCRLLVNGKRLEKI